MKFKTINTKTNEEHIFDEKEVEHLFRNDVVDAGHYYIDEVNEILNDTCGWSEEEEDAEEEKHAWLDSITVYNDYKEYLTFLIENESWCSPRGVTSVFQVTEVME